MEDISMDELIESDLLRKVRIVPYSEEFQVHPILHEPLIGPDDVCDYSRHRDEDIGDISSEDVHKKFPN
jgi:hypothetical protein